MLIVIAAADSTPVTRAEALAQIRIMDEAQLDTGQLGLVDDMLEEAVEVVERESGVTLAPTSFEQSFACWPHARRCLQLAAFPVRDVLEVVYLDADGEEVALDAADFTWSPTAAGADVRIATTFSWPTLSREIAKPVRIRFEAGFDAPADELDEDADPRLRLPRPARNAVRLLISAWFQNRDGQGLLTDAASDLVELFKVYR